MMVSARPGALKLVAGFIVVLMLAGCAAPDPEHGSSVAKRVSHRIPVPLNVTAAAEIIDHPVLKERVRAREIDVATDPNNPQHMAAVMMVPWPTQYALKPYDSMEWTGIALSNDGGKTWDYKPLPGYPGDTSVGYFPGAWAVGDAVLTFQPDGSLLMACLPIRYPIQIAVAVVQFPWGSRTPTFVSELAQGAVGVNGAQNVPTSQVGPHVDKEQIYVDPTTHHVYITYSERWQQSSEARIMFSKSSDSGRTWSQPVPIDDPLPHYIGSGKHQMGPRPFTTKDGKLLVIWADLRSSTMYVSESKDEGATWLKPKVISQHPGFFILSMDMDTTGGANDGTIYAAIEDSRNGDKDVYLSVSRDNGVTWDDSVRVNQDTLGNKRSQRMPEVVVEPDGAVSIIYMGEVDKADNWYAFVARSIDAGRTFTEYRVSTAGTSVASINNQPSFLTHLGDYLGISYSPTGLIPMWQDGRKSTADTPYSEAWMVEMPTRVSSTSG